MTNSPSHPTSLRTALILAALFVAQIVTYWPSFHVKPASDDFPYINEINRGNREGVSVFFTRSFTGLTYRPLASLGLWIAGQVSDTIEGRIVAIRALHFFCMAMYLVAVFLWLRLLRFSLVAQVSAAILFLFHPVLPLSLSTIDGFNALSSSAMLWFGGWMIARFPGRLAVVIPSIIAIFALGVGGKEYTLGLIPLAAIVIYYFWPRKLWTRGVIVIGVLIACFIVLLLIRRAVMPPETGGATMYLSHNPIDWLKNAATFATGLLFFGNSIWVFERYSRQILLIVAATCFAALLLIGVGLFTPRPKRDESDSSDDALTYPRLLTFLILGLGAATCPALLMLHVSEMYVPPMLLPFALLVGLAMEGINRRSPFDRRVALLGCVVALLFSISAIRTKIVGLRDVGERAEHQLREALSFVPAGERDKQLLLLFASRNTRETFSSYLMGDENLLVHSVCPEWIRPDQNITLHTFVMTDRPAAKPEDFDIVLYWQPSTKTFSRLK